MNDLFPFFVMIDRDLFITAVGKSIAKLGFTKAGDPFFDHFTIERPLQTSSFADIRRQSSALFILNTQEAIGLKFRGQMYFDESNEQLVFLGSPLINSFDDLKGVDLTLNDFALHDNINQFLFTTQMLISSLKDSKNIELRLEKSNQDLKQKNDELQDLAHILSHDLKSPIRGILSLAEFMQDDIDHDKLDELPFYIKTIKERIVRMNSLIEGVLDFSKIGIEKSKKESIDLNELVQTVFMDTITHENIEYNIKTPLPTIHNVRVLFVQLFSNLISNAVKHNDKTPGVITIDYKEWKDFHEFSIEDNGPGISEKYHEKIFKLFQTLQAGDKMESTGVGLSIVKKIITLLNGSIKVESKVDEGTTFYIKIPKT
jgi:signal transduction histidine kinase